MGIYDVCTFKPNQTILIVVQKSPGNPMSDEENTRYSKETKKQDFILKAYNLNNDYIFMSIKVIKSF